MNRNVIDLTGNRYGKLTVLKKASPHITKGGAYITMWECQCDCGNKTIVSSQKLRNGHTTSCGCAKHEMKPRKKDLEGKRFGRLTVIKFLEQGEREDKRRQWLCKCDCGNYSQVSGAKLINGHTKSCGCAVVDFIGSLNRKYPNKDKRIYRIWRAIHNRCYAENNREFNNYGGRGITICDEWKEENSGYTAFHEWAVNNGYSEGLTIDRIDVDKGYSPDNCRWITNKEQQNNRRDNVLLTYNGETHTMKEWSEILNVSYHKLRYHIRIKDRTLQYFIENCL